MLGLGVLFQLAMISALPLGDLHVAETRGLLSLCVLLIVSAVSVIALRRFPRGALAALGIASAYCLFRLVRLAPWAMFIDIIRGLPVQTTYAASVSFASIMLAILPIALIIAWPLRNTGRDSH